MDSSQIKVGKRLIKYNKYLHQQETYYNIFLFHQKWQ